jgi:hypothetical protein
VLACGGSKGEIAIWDISESKKVEEHFKPHLIKGSYDVQDYDIDNTDHELPPQEDDFEDMDEDDDSEEEAKKLMKKDKKYKSKK